MGGKSAAARTHLRERFSLAHRTPSISNSTALTSSLVLCILCELNLLVADLNGLKACPGLRSSCECD